MLTNKEISEIKTYLKNSENPLFFFDDDNDGLSSFLLLNKYIDSRGHGVVVKSSPLLDVQYLNKVQEYNPDIVFVLDKPKISQEFVNAVNVPIVWIDHHEPQNIKGVHYYNPRKENSTDGRCTTYWCYKVVKQDLWIATLGSISDWQVPDYIDEFEKKYGLIDGKRLPNEILFETNFGEFCRLVSFLLKGKTSDVRKRINAMMKISGPSEILNQETVRGKFLYRESSKVKKRYDELIKLAMTMQPRGNLHVFIYPSGKLSLTSDLSNELLHRFPKRIILVGREKDGFMRLSLRSTDFILPDILTKSLEGIEGYGGGHEHACGGNIAVKDFDKFVNNLVKYTSK